MGTTYSAELIAGVKLVEIQVFEEVTKYNEDTGEAYIKKIPDTMLVIEGTSIVVDPDKFVDEGGPLVYNNCYRFGKHYLGHSLGSVNGDGYEPDDSFTRIMPSVEVLLTAISNHLEEALDYKGGAELILAMDAG